MRSKMFGTGGCAMIVGSISVDRISFDTIV